MLLKGRAARFGTGLALGGLLMVGGASALAQDASPVATQVTTGEVAHPAHIHSGTCDALGEVVFPLGDVGMPATGDDGTMGTPMASEMVGATDAIPVYSSVTQLDASLDQILSAPHAINVHESAENIGNYIACGNIGGTRQGDTIMFGLRALNNSGYSGVGLISQDADGSANVVVYLSHDAMMGGMGEQPAATPTS